MTQPIDDPALDPRAHPGTEGVGAQVPDTRLSILGHQEVSRILEELEDMSSHVLEAAGPDTWLTAQAAKSLLLQHLGYEDEAELEDAIHGDFESFLELLPHIETKIQEEEGSAKGMLVFRTKRAEVPEGERRPTMKIVHVRDRHDLWRVLDKSKDARIEIPALEFEISQDNKRCIDSLYNHIGKAIFNLGRHVREVMPATEEYEDTRYKIMETVMALNAMLDVEVPWTFVIHDESGESQVYPDDGIDTVFTDTPQQ